MFSWANVNKSRFKLKEERYSRHFGYVLFVRKCILLQHRSYKIQYVTLDHKSSLKCQSFEIKIYNSSESWINKLPIDVWFVWIKQYLAELFENLESEGAKKSKLLLKLSK